VTIRPHPCYPFASPVTTVRLPAISWAPSAELCFVTLVEAYQTQSKGMDYHCYSDSSKASLFWMSLCSWQACIVSAPTGKAGNIRMEASVSLFSYRCFQLYTYSHWNFPYRFTYHFHILDKLWSPAKEWNRTTNIHATKNNEGRCRRHIFGRYPVRIVVFRLFAQSLQANAGIMP
jgi:hypothetical protein